MRKFSALAVVSLLALTGCAAPTAAESAPATVTVTDTQEAQAENISESEISAKSLALPSAPAAPTEDSMAEAQSAKSYEQQREEFASFINPEFSGWTGELPAEEELLSAAKLACKQLKDGKASSQVEVIKGSVYKFTKEQEKKLTYEQKRALSDTPNAANNQRLVTAAASAFCLEYLS